MGKEKSSKADLGHEALVDAVHRVHSDLSIQDLRSYSQEDLISLLPTPQKPFDVGIFFAGRAIEIRSAKKARRGYLKH